MRVIVVSDGKDASIAPKGRIIVIKGGIRIPFTHFMRAGLHSRLTATMPLHDTMRYQRSAMKNLGRPAGKADISWTT